MEGTLIGTWWELPWGDRCSGGVSTAEVVRSLRRNVNGKCLNADLSKHLKKNRSEFLDSFAWLPDHSFGAGNEKSAGCINRVLPLIPNRRSTVGCRGRKPAKQSQMRAKSVKSGRL
jgi:hypothetical protein